MTQFIQLNKLTTDHTGEVEPFLFNKHSFLIMERQTVRNAAGLQFIATRVVLSGHPEYTFFTPVDMDVLGAALDMVDGTQGFTPGGSQCAGDPGVISSVTVNLEYPMLKLLRIENKIWDDTVEYVCNPNLLLWAEEQSFQDAKTQLPQTALMITFGGTTPRRVLTKLSFADLVAILEPDIL